MEEILKIIHKETEMFEVHDKSGIDSIRNSIGDNNLDGTDLLDPLPELNE